MRTSKFENIKQDIIDYYNNNNDISELAIKLDCHRTNLYKLLQSWGVKKKRQYDKLDIDEDKIVELHTKNYSLGQIALELNINRSTIALRARKLNLSFSHKKPISRTHILKENKERILELFSDDVSCQDIGKIFKIDHSAITKFLRKNGFDPSPVRYSVNHNFFEIIDSEEKAYILGLWFSDGSISKHLLRLSMTDEDIVYKVKEALNFTGPVSERKTLTKSGKKVYSLDITSEKMVGHLIEMGCTYRKSLTLEFPYKHVPEHLMRHFLRGMFDGDGCIYTNKSGYHSINMTGTKEICEGFSKTTCLAGKCRHAGKRSVGKNTFYWIINKQKEIRYFLDLLYKDSKIHLDRKKERADKILIGNFFLTGFYKFYNNIKDKLAVEVFPLTEKWLREKNYLTGVRKRSGAIILFEDEWNNRRDQVKDFLLAKAGKFERQVYGRKCSIEEVDKKLAAAFISANHIQPTNNGGVINFGLYFQEELLGLLQLRKHHRQKAEIVISRICFLRGVQIIGGFSKLIKHAVGWCKENGHSVLVTWSDNRWTNGDSYIKGGFTLDKELPPDYSYVKMSDLTRKSKQSMKKSNIGCPANITEREYTLQLGYERVWDCGKKRFVYKV